MVVYAARCAQARQGAYRLLALAARQAWGLEELPRMERRAGGKPYFPDRPELEFNLSHSGDLLLCALDGSPVGADIQQVRAMRPGLPRRVCSPGELAWVEEGGPEALWERFARLWALKEALVKCTGTGLTRSIPGIQVPLLSGEETLARLDGLWFRSYRGEDWMGAVCGSSPPPADLRWAELPPGPDILPPKG